METLAIETKTITIEDKNYVCMQASALKQDELLSCLSAKLFMSFKVAAKLDTDINESSVAIMLMALPSDVKAKVVDILTEKVTAEGSKVRVSVKDFQGRMVLWNTLLAKLLIWNLQDFFDLLRFVQKAEA